MSKFKYEWPYIQFLTRTEEEEYVSDLPANLNELKVFHIVPSLLYDHSAFLDKPMAYTTPEEHLRNENFITNSSIWGTIYLGTVMKSVWSMTKWYNTNVITNYSYFKTETWGRYFRLRFWAIFVTAWTAYHFSYVKTFSNYPKLIR